MNYRGKVMVFFYTVTLIASIVVYSVAANLDGEFYAEQHKATPLTQMTGPDTSDVVYFYNDWGSIAYHLVVSGIDDSVFVKCEGSVDNSDSTFVNLDTTGHPTRITANGAYALSFEPANIFHYYRLCWIPEAGGDSSAVITPNVIIGRSVK